MNIYDINGDVWLSDVPITPACEAVMELMKDDYVQLVWNAASNAVIPVGSYISYNGERYSLLEPYLPDQRSESQWTYSPKFHSAYRGLSKVPFFMYTAGGGKEAEWSLTDSPVNFMSVLCAAILNETGIRYTYSVASDLTIASATCAFNCTDIQSAISEIASAFDTEIWLEKYSNADANGNVGCLHIGKASHGTAVELEVGTNIKVPSVTRNGEFFNRFYVFGSSRNITQDYAGANVNNLATKRLTLSPTDYPNGYIDFSDGGPVFSKVLQFDDIYPAATDLVVMNIRSWLRYRRDEATSEKIVVGTDPVTGQPVYDMYAVWFVNLKRKVNGSYVDFTFNNTTYDKDDNPSGMLLPGLVPSLHFNSGPLAGREFEVIYHANAETLSDGSDGSTFNVLAGDFEIKYVEEGTYIIPAVIGLIPTTDNLVVLFNVMMPSAYVADAEERLETVALDEIARNYIDPDTLEAVDKNVYQAESDPVAFSDDDPNLTLGSKVLYINGTYEKESRVTRIVKKLDHPCKQTIVFGDEIIKGNIEELKEEAVSANRNIDLLSALNKTTAELTAAYERTHQLVLKQLADQASMFIVQRDGSVKLNSIYTGLWTDGWLAAGGEGEDGGGGGGGLISSVYGKAALGSVYSQSGSDDLTKTFSAYAIDFIYKSLTDLQSATPNVSLVNGENYSTVVINNTTADFYTKTQVDALVASVNSFEYVVVQTLPTASAATMGKLYLVPSDNPSTPNVKETYVTVRSGTAPNYTYSWEQIGSTDIDLSGYVPTSRQVNGHALSSDVTITKGDIGLGNVENTAISNWTGSQNITTLGTISTGSIPLSLITGASDLKAIEALTGTTGLLKKTAADTWTLDTTAYLTASSLTDYALKTGDSSYNFLVNTLKFSTTESLIKGGTSAKPRIQWKYNDGSTSPATSATKTLAFTDEIPTALKCPYKLTFKNASGTTTKQYDGSENNTITAADLGALTGHQQIYGLTVSAGTFTATTWNPAEANGSFNVPTTLDHLGDGTTRKLSNYLPLAGGTMTGTITMSGANIFPSASHTCNIGASSAFFAGLYGDTIHAHAFELYSSGSVQAFRLQGGIENAGTANEVYYALLTLHQGTGEGLYITKDTMFGMGTAKDLGKTYARWKGIYGASADLTGNLDLGGVLRVNSLNTIDQSNETMSLFNFGARATKTFNAYGTGANFRACDSSGNQVNILAINATKIQAGSDFIPNYTEGLNLGGSSANTRWANIYGVNANLTGNLAFATASHIDIGPLRIEYDATNKALHITKADSSDTTEYGIYADGFVGAGGIQESS